MENSKPYLSLVWKFGHSAGLRCTQSLYTNSAISNATSFKLYLFPSYSTASFALLDMYLKYWKAIKISQVKNKNFSKSYSWKDHNKSYNTHFSYLRDISDFTIGSKTFLNLKDNFPFQQLHIAYRLWIRKWPPGKWFMQLMMML